MKRSAILLGLQRKPSMVEKKITDNDDDDWEWNYELKRGDEIVIADDTLAHQIFGDKIFSAPQEDILEGKCSNRHRHTLILTWMSI